MAGRCPSNSTSMTAPITATTLPACCAVVCSIRVFARSPSPNPSPSARAELRRGGALDPGSRFLECLRAGDHLDDLAGDGGLAQLVQVERQAVDHLARVL